MLARIVNGAPLQPVAPFRAASPYLGLDHRAVRRRKPSSRQAMVLLVVLPGAAVGAAVWHVRFWETCEICDLDRGVAVGPLRGGL